MSSDAYGERLDEIIRLFQDYKSGSVKLDNITKLCQTLGLESFIEDVEPDVSRLSAASKIIVIDIDFAKGKGKVTDVKLVLASNFDNFNYYVDQYDNESASGNILLNSLTHYQDLHEFHHNLKYLHLLDTFSNIDIDASNGSTNANGTNFTTGEASGQGAYSGKMDLFKYHTELAQFIRHYFEANSAPFKVHTNLHNRFGIYVLAPDGGLSAKIYLARAKDSRQRLYEFTYQKDSQDWINESAENYTCGVSLVMEILCDELSCWFPQDFIPDDLIQSGSGEEQRTSAKFDLNELIQSSKNNASFNTKFELVNDFNGKLINLRTFDISNDNLNLILEILNWLQWSQKVLQPVLTLLFGPSEIANEAKAQDGQGVMGGTRPRRSSASSGHKRRRFSGNRRPSITEATMLRDEGFQQFTLNEILTNPKVAAAQQSADPNIASQDKMDVNYPADEGENPIQLVVSEDHVSLADIAHCSLYDASEKWETFINIIQQYTPK